MAKSKKLIKIFFLIILSFSFFCLSVEKKIYHPDKKYARTNPEKIIISYAIPEKKHVKLGELSVRFNSGYKRETALGLLTQTAAEYGADGIILQPIRRINDRFSVTNSSAETSDSSMQIENYELGGIMYRFLSE